MAVEVEVIVSIVSVALVDVLAGGGTYRGGLGSMPAFWPRTIITSTLFLSTVTPGGGRLTAVALRVLAINSAVAGLEFT